MKIKGISVCNPVDVDKEYLLFTVDYAIKMGFDHLQVIGPIHNGIKGNIDGMTLYRKYSQFNNEKDADYVAVSMDAVNEGCKLASEHGIKTYMWHHELELPSDFQSVYPEVTNSFGDVEVTHPLVKDFLENKIIDFFHAYPYMDGIILTLHETKVPLLKLKDQKLGKVERVKYVTEILYNTCRALGKELIVRPFASLEEDYIMMAKAYEEISKDLMIMDKWTQFDWSLSLPNNAFYHKIQNNPLFVEADIFGEFFGKGFLPMMLKEHIAEKFAYCEEFEPAGYVARIDRQGEHPFGDVNEVNLVITHAHLNELDVETEIDAFFRERYGEATEEVKSIMEETEEILKKTIYAKGYYYTELSFFPTLNHSKNHYYFEMMRENCDIASNEWYIPRGWDRGSVDSILEEKNSAVQEATRLYERVCALEHKLDQETYQKLWTKFCNLKMVTELWFTLANVYRDYVNYFDTRDVQYETQFKKDVALLLEKHLQAKELLGEKYYCIQNARMNDHGADVEEFISEIRRSFQLEKESVERLEKEALLDYVVCGGALEAHRLQKEVNFSDTLIKEDALCRIPGNRRGMEWSSINAHGWFSYEVKVAPYTENTIQIIMEGARDVMDVCVHIGDQEHKMTGQSGERKEYTFSYVEQKGEDAVRIRFDKISGNTPCVFKIKVERI